MESGTQTLTPMIGQQMFRHPTRIYGKQNIDYQKVPPHVHRRNAAKRAIRTFKNHFIAGLCSLDKKFPIHLWDKLLEQAEITLNLLQLRSNLDCKINQCISACNCYSNRFIALICSILHY